MCQIKWTPSPIPISWVIGSSTNTNVNSHIVAQSETVNSIPVLIVSGSTAVSISPLSSPRKFFFTTNHHIQYLVTIFFSQSESCSQFRLGTCRFVLTDDQNDWDERAQSLSPNFWVLWSVDFLADAIDNSRLHVEWDLGLRETSLEWWDWMFFAALWTRRLQTLARMRERLYVCLSVDTWMKFTVVSPDICSCIYLDLRGSLFETSSLQFRPVHMEMVVCVHKWCNVTKGDSSFCAFLVELLVVGFESRLKHSIHCFSDWFAFSCCSYCTNTLDYDWHVCQHARRLLQNWILLRSGALSFPFYFFLFRNFFVSWLSWRNVALVWDVSSVRVFPSSSRSNDWRVCYPSHSSGGISDLIWISTRIFSVLLEFVMNVWWWPFHEPCLHEIEFCRSRNSVLCECQRFLRKCSVYLQKNSTKRRESIMYL